MVRMVVNAGPGTGKTEAVAHRLVSLLTQDLKPAQILVLSFSRNAVRTLIARIARIEGVDASHCEQLRHLSVRTFDSWTFRVLRQLGHSPSELLTGTHDDNIGLLIRKLRGQDRAEVARLLENVRHIIVDEFQDLSGVRGALVLELLGLLAPPGSTGTGFTVLGDPAQAIYAFSLQPDLPEHMALTCGALIERVNATYKDNLENMSLAKNYRAGDSLGSLASNMRNLLLRRTSGDSKFDAMCKLVAKIQVSEEGLKAGALLYGEIRTAAVLTSTNGEAIRVAQKLSASERSDIPIFLHTSSKPRIVPLWIGATLGPLKSESLTRSQFCRIYKACYGGEMAPRRELLHVPDLEVAWQRLAKVAGVPPDTLSLDMNTLRSRLNWVDILPDDEGPLSAGIHVMTIHQSKGMEFDSVAVLAESLVERQFESDAQRLEAANVLFVGMTRAAKRLLRIEQSQTYGPMFPTGGGESRRWCAWQRGWVNFEMGLPNDVDAQGFIDRQIFSENDVLCSDSVIEESQKYLADNSDKLAGAKLVLCRWKVPNSVPTRHRYRIHLQEGEAPGRLVGATTDSLTRALLSLLFKKGYTLPNRIYNLRITEVATMCLSGDARSSLATPFSQSGVWLGIHFYGSGDFKPTKFSPSKRA